MNLGWNREDRATRWAKRAQRGDRGAFRDLYRALHPVVARYVARRVRVSADAEDLVANVFHKLVEHLDDFDPAKGTVTAWSLRVARNAVVDHHRAARRTAPIEAVADGLCAPDGSPLDRVLEGESLGELTGLLASCSDASRRLISMRYGDELSHKDIAASLGLSEVAVRKRLSRALTEIRRHAIEAHNTEAREPDYAV